MKDLQFDNEILTVQEAAAFLKICRVNAYGLFNRKDFPSFKIGKSLRVCKSDLIYFVRNSSVQQVS
jgi:predicted DNA-binding transcriptional regulator AlpA